MNVKRRVLDTRNFKGDKALAAEEDRKWFRQNPDRAFRIRRLSALEDDHPKPPAETGYSWYVIVHQMGPGVRTRRCITIADYSFDPDAYTPESECILIAKKVFPSEIMKFYETQSE